MIDDALQSTDLDEMDIDEEAEKMLRDIEINVMKNMEKKKMEEGPGQLNEMD